MSRVDEIRARLAESIAAHAKQHPLERTVSGTCTNCGNTRTGMVTGWFAAEINRRESDLETLLAELDAAMRVVEAARAWKDDTFRDSSYFESEHSLDDALREFDARKP